MEGYLQVDFDTLSVGSLLAPNAIGSSQSQAVKTQFDDLQAHLNKMARKRRDFIFCGDWAVRPARDVTDEAASQLSGFLPEEQQWMRQLPHIGYVDAFREVDNVRRILLVARRNRSGTRLAQ